MNTTRWIAICTFGAVLTAYAVGCGSDGGAGTKSPGTAGTGSNTQGTAGTGSNTQGSAGTFGQGQAGDNGAQGQAGDNGGQGTAGTNGTTGAGGTGGGGGGTAGRGGGRNDGGAPDGGTAGRRGRDAGVNLDAIIQDILNNRDARRDTGGGGFDANLAACAAGVMNNTACMQGAASCKPATGTACICVNNGGNRRWRCF
jgi:hypothetical protein